MEMPIRPSRSGKRPIGYRPITDVERACFIFRRFNRRHRYGIQNRLSGCEGDGFRGNFGNV